MSLFDQVLTQPILNLLAFIYNFIGDFGVSIIILTILVRIILWPLVKKQLHQARKMREIQPELRKIKARANGNRMLESTMMMELYREKNLKPFSSIFVVLIQLPIMIAIFRVIQIFSGTTYNNTNGTNPADFIYPTISHMGKIPELIASQHLTLFGLDLKQTAATYLPALLLAVIVAFLQYYQSKQLMPNDKNARKLKDMFRDAANGKEIDQSDMMSATSRNMIYMMPIMMFMISFALPGAVVLYYAVTSLIAIGQQHYILERSGAELTAMTKEPLPKVSKRERNAKEAVIVRKKDLNISPKNKTNGGQTVVRRKKLK